METLTIGQMAQANCVSVRTLRLYQEKGLLEPSVVDPQTHRRYYHVGQSATLDLITDLQQTGFSLSDIKEIIDSGSLEHLKSQSKTRLDEIDAEIAKLTKSRQAAASIIESCNEYFSNPPLGEIILERLPERKIIRFDYPNTTTQHLEHSPSSLSEAAHNDIPSDGTAQQYEWAMRHTKQTMANLELPLTLYRNIGTIIDRNSLESSSTREIATFVLLDDVTEPPPPTNALAEVST